MTSPRPRLAVLFKTTNKMATASNHQTLLRKGYSWSLEETVLLISLYEEMKEYCGHYSRNFTDRNNITQYELRDTVGKLAVPLPRTNYLKTVLVTKVRCFGTAYHMICGKHKLSMVFELVADIIFLSHKIFYLL